MTLTSLVQI